MPRPKKYTKPEERVLATRSYRAKYYASNRGLISKKRAEKRKASTGETGQVAAKACAMGTPFSENHTLLSRRPGRPIGAKNFAPVWNTGIESELADSEPTIEAAFKTIIGLSSRQKMQALCERYITSRDYKEIYNVLSEIEVLEKRLKRITPTPHWQNNALECLLSKGIRTVIKLLENLLLSAMEGEDLCALLHKGLLLYQAAPDIIL